MVKLLYHLIKSATNGTTIDITLSATTHDISIDDFVEIKGLKSSTDLDVSG